MLNALLIGNPASAAGHRLRDVRVPGRWITEPGAVTTQDVREADLVALFGGDGTMQITLSRILDELPASELPPIAVMPFGTTNMNAADLNRSRGRKATVASLDHAVRSGELDCIARSLVRVGDGNHTHHGFFFGMGAIATVVRQWNDERKPGPLLNQLRSLWAMLTGLTAVNSAHAIELNGRPHAVYGLIGTTLDRLLFGARPYWGHREGNLLRLTWVDADAPALLRHAPALLRGNPRLAEEPGYESLSTCRATLGFEGPYVIDGELFEAPRAALVIEPSPPLTWIRL
jgi:diacylglycerol kinase (ATP)